MLTFTTLVLTSNHVRRHAPSAELVQQSIGTRQMHTATSFLGLSRTNNLAAHFPTATHTTLASGRASQILSCRCVPWKLVQRGYTHVERCEEY
mmetsp:Transcript_88462/g.166750  ORF Transcript_88462/g.166750 Transcript_88462/m.166750 type:complete len:93 (-) Transcript_88462:26-304(-)